MKQPKDAQQIIRDFKLRQSRQFLAIGLALFFLILLVLIHSRADLFGEVSKSTVFGAQFMVIVAFIVFSAFNWRCPSCRRYLGNDISKRVCRHCRARLC
jgi:hypothetical protein